MPDNENKLATIEPETREETFLQDIADGTQTLTPAVRKEEFLRRISVAMGEGGGGGGSTGVCLVGVKALSEMADAPDGRSTDELYADYGVYLGIIDMFDGVMEVEFAIEYPDSDDSSYVIVSKMETEDGGPEVRFISNYYINEPPVTGSPAPDDELGEAYYLTVAQPVSVKISSTEEIPKIVVPYNTEFKWVRAQGFN